MLALHQLDDPGRAQAVRAQGHEVLGVLEAGDAARGLDLHAGAEAALQEEIAAAQEALDKAKTELETAKAEERQRQTELEAAQATVATAETELQGKQATLEQANKDKATAEQEVAAAAAQVKAAQEEQAKAEATLTARQAETAAAKKAVDDAKTAQTQAAANLEKAREVKRTADVAVIAAQAEIENAEKAVAEADANFNKGSFGFFEAMGSQAAIDILNNAKYASYTKKGDPNDATSLENMKVTFKWIREANRLRALEGLAPLKVTDLLMAMAQSNANWSDTNMDHSRQPHKNPDALMTGEIYPGEQEMEPILRIPLVIKPIVEKK